MREEKLKAMAQGELINLVLDYEKRFKMINEIMSSYGTISNDDLLGLIDKSIPDIARE